MSSNILIPVITALENLYEAFNTLDTLTLLDRRKEDDLILRHINLFADKTIVIDDFRNDLEWFNVSKRLSLSDDLRGKVVVLDFFTYCCINCLHLLPHLKELEQQFSIEDGLVVVGVHSAKFDNEKDSANLLAAIQRYNITHPVVNDADGIMWNTLGIPCWPTMLIIGPSGEALFVLVGEKQTDDLFRFVKIALTYYKDCGQLSHHSLPVSSDHIAPTLKSSLLFPGKVACSSKHDNNNDAPEPDNNNMTNGERLAVSDTGHHRIIVCTTAGKIEHVIGGDESGFVDGNFVDTRFHSPQGVTFHNPELLYVADTENNAIREINLKTMNVTTLVRNGPQSSVVLSSPWDVCMMSSTLLCGQEESDNDVLLIAMAGAHQIWAFFLNTATWWKNRVYSAGTCAAIIGNGREENRNNSYPHAAGFAQPSGLTVSPQLQAIFVADSESSSIRRISLTDGKVSAVVGGDRVPNNLFTFGDRDGKQFEAKLQHPLGVSWCGRNRTLYIADSYNHKLKSVDVLDNVCTTVLGSGKPGNSMGYYNTAECVQLSEPGGLCASRDGLRLYVADTNNHGIKVVHLEDKKIEKLPIFLPTEETQKQESRTGSDVVMPTDLRINRAGGEISLFMSLTLGDEVSLTPIAPQKWKLQLPDGTWSASSCAGDYESEMMLRIFVPEQKEANNASFSVNYRLYMCLDHSQCTVKDLSFVFSVIYADDVPDKVTHHFTHVIESRGKRCSSYSLPSA